MKDIYQILDELHIVYEKHEHPAVFTVEEAEKYDRGIDAGKSKNLFLRNKKGNNHYLLIAESTKRFDLDKVSEIVQDKKLSFASPERMQTHLGLTPGSVSPFGLINNSEKSVKVLVDKGLLNYEKLAYHPNINTATLVVSKDDLIKFLEWTGNSITYVDL